LRQNRPASHTSALGESFIADEWQEAQEEVYKVGAGGLRVFEFVQPTLPEDAVDASLIALARLFAPGFVVARPPTALAMKELGDERERGLPRLPRSARQDVLDRGFLWKFQRDEFGGLRAGVGDRMRVAAGEPSVVAGF
jgi:hypothetical protein